VAHAWLVRTVASVPGDSGALAFTREGAHSRNGILHAHGYSTGHEIARSQRA
jgi:aspartate oxidase